MVNSSEDLGRRIRELRTSLCLSQKELSDHLNIAHNTLSRYETGSRHPGIETYHILKESFCVNLNWLIAGEGDMFSYENLSFKDIDSLKKFVLFITDKGNILKKYVFSDSSAPGSQLS
jgi:transcriptional regulator with XRE-family HTH domain